MFSVNIAHNPNMQPIIQRYDCIPTTLEQKGERTFFPVFHRKSLRTLIIWSARETTKYNIITRTRTLPISFIFLFSFFTYNIVRSFFSIPFVFTAGV